MECLNALDVKAERDVQNFFYFIFNTYDNKSNK